MKQISSLLLNLSLIVAALCTTINVVYGDNQDASSDVDGTSGASKTTTAPARTKVRKKSVVEPSTKTSESELPVDSLVLLTTEGVKQLYLTEDITQAKKEFEAALAIDSTYSPAHYSLSQLLLYYGDRAKAVYHANVAYQSDTTNFWYLDNYGKTLLANQDYDASNEIFERILKQKPNDVNAYRVLAILYQRVNESDKAIALLDSAEMRVGHNPYLFDIKQQLLVNTNQRERAIEECRELIDIAPYEPEYRVSLAELYSSIGEDSLAYTEYLEALKIDSMSLSTLVSLGSFMNRRGDYKDYMIVLNRIIRSPDVEPKEKVALIEEVLSNRKSMKLSEVSIIRLITTLVEQHPNNPDVVLLLASYHIAAGNIEEGSKVVKRHLGDEPPKYDYYRMVIDIERYLGRVDSLGYYLGEAMRVFPDNRSLPMEWAHTLVMQQRYDEAIAEYESMLIDASDSVSGAIWCMIADLELFVANGMKQEPLATQERAKDRDKRVSERLKSSFEAYEKSLKYQPDNALTLNNYAYSLVEHGTKKELPKALEMAKRVISLTSGNPMYLDTHGWALYKMGEYDEAKSSMRQAIALDSQRSYDIALHYGAVLFVLEEITMAEYYWEKALEWGATPEMIAEERAEAEVRQLERTKSKR